MALALVRLAWLGRAHGLRGEIKATLTADELSWLQDAKKVWLEVKDEAPRQIEIEKISAGGPELRLKIKGISDRDAADALRGATLSVEASTLPEPQDGRFWVHQVIGYTVQDKRRGEIGVLKSIIPTGANDCLEIQGKETETFLVPLTDETFSAVDHQARRIDMDLLDGSIPGEIEDGDDDQD